MQLFDERSSISIAIRGWQCRDENGEEDWLILGLSLVDPHGAWKASGAFATFEEMRSLAAWMSRLARSQNAKPNRQFLEPNLEVALVRQTEDAVEIRIRLDGECLPPWRPFSGVFYDDGEDYFLTLQVSHEQLAIAAGTLVAEREALTAKAVRPRPIN